MPKPGFANGKPGPVPGFFLLLAMCACGPTEQTTGDVGRSVRITIPATLEDGDIAEASGLTHSQRAAGLLWTHNDSGAKARLYAFGTDGKMRGRIKLAPADNDDWEDLASFADDDRSYLVVADIGDNEARRKHLTLYTVEEPDLSDDARPELPPFSEIDFRYPDGPRDAEAMAIDVANDRVLIMTKRDLPPRLYAVPLHAESEDAVEASFLGTISTLPQPSRQDVAFAPKTGEWHWQPTAMDIARDGAAIAVLTYSAIYYYERQAREDWVATLQRPPLALDIKNIRNAEAIAFSPDGRSLFVTVEKKHAPLLRIDFLDE